MLDPVKDIIRLIGLPDPALHALIGAAIYLGSAAILRLPLRSWYPWLIALGAQSINEAADVALDVLRGDVFRWRGSLLDTAVTLALPTIIVLASGWRHRSIEARATFSPSDSPKDLEG